MSADTDEHLYQSIDGMQLTYEIYGRKFALLSPKYSLPIDAEEIKRFHLLHRLIQFVFDGHIYIGPIKEALQFGPYRKVLDVGTGRGYWAVEMCEEFPWVYVTGADLVPIQFEEVPERCRYEYPLLLTAATDIQDRFELWDFNDTRMPYDDATFDVIHARFIHTGIVDYPRFLKELGRLLRDGGLVILIEHDLQQFADGKSETEYTFGSGPRGWFTLWETYRSCLLSLGIDITVPGRLSTLLEETGMFKDIVFHRGTIPVGFWPKDPRILTIGQLQWMAYDLLLPALKPVLVSLGLLESRVDRMIKEAQQDLYHSTSNLSSLLHVTYASRIARV